MQASVDTTNHLIVDHEVTNVGHDRTQLYTMAKRSKEALEAEQLSVVCDRGYYRGEEIRDCDADGISDGCALQAGKDDGSGATDEDHDGMPDTCSATCSGAECAVVGACPKNSRSTNNCRRRGSPGPSTWAAGFAIAVAGSIWPTS